MTVNEYRAKHPKCEYCKHYRRHDSTCVAKELKYPKAKRCKLYGPRPYGEKPWDPFEKPEPGMDFQPI